MNKHDLIKMVDSEKYKSDCKIAKDSAIYIGKQDSPYKSVTFETAHDLSWIIWDLEISESEKLDIFIELYKDMPCYGYLMYLYHEFKDSFSKNTQEKVINWISQIIKSDEETYRTPILYSLWCDYLEDQDCSDYIWKELLSSARDNQNAIEVF